MNREMKRLMQRQGQMEADGSPATARREPPRTRPRPTQEAEISALSKVVEFGRDVRSELRQVAWPTRTEVANSATVVFIVLVLMVSLIFALNFAFSHGVIDLLNVGG